MTANDQPQQDRQTEELPEARDDRRKQTVNPAQAPVPANPPVEPDEVERGREKLDRLADS